MRSRYATTRGIRASQSAKPCRLSEVMRMAAPFSRRNASQGPSQFGSRLCIDWKRRPIGEAVGHVAARIRCEQPIEEVPMPDPSVPGDALFGTGFAVIATLVVLVFADVIGLPIYRAVRLSRQV